jgi:DNA-binding CsgD family transcriptional regulator/tetratricopeptide (TPR) repeat protein
VSRTALKRTETFTSAYAAALSAWFQGDYAETLRILGSSDPRVPNEHADSHLLAARARVRAGQFDVALEDARLALSRAGDGDRRATAQMLAGAALSRMGRLSEAQAALKRASELPSVHRTIAAEIALQKGFLAFKSRDLAAARQEGVDATRLGTDIVLGRAHELVAHIDALEANYPAAKEGFLAAVRALAKAKYRDALLEANVLHLAAALSFETLSLESTEYLTLRLRALQETPETRTALFQASQALGLMQALRGDDAAAWTLFQDAAAYARDDPPFRATAMTTLATFTRVHGDVFGPRQYLGQAWSLLKGVEWDAMDGDRRIALLEWAIEALRSRHGGSRVAIETYQRLSAGPGDKAFDVGDRRVKATLRHALALLKRDAEELRAAVRGWEELGYTFRAATAAVDLAHLTAEPRDVTLAHRLARTVKGVLLKKPVADLRSRQRSGIGGLTEAERRVLDAILEGRTAQQIADESGRALQTIKNQTRSIFEQLCVTSRPELFVLCRRLGLTR